MVEIATLCPGCMATTAAQSPCPLCGYVRGEERNPLALPERSVLNERFVLGRVLGKPGGYGITYLAWDMTLKTTAAIKEYLPRQLATRKSGDTVVNPNSVDDGRLYSDGLTEFLDEARILVRFTHPNIARVRDFFTENNTAYLVMDYYEGMSLAEYLKARQRVLSKDEAIALITPILDGLSVVHQDGYLHRDIKPANIYIIAGNVPILLDFGSARQTLGEETASLSVILTPGFAPFEQYLRKGKQGPWTDIYSCAATLYYAMSGIKPLAALDREDENELEPLHSVNPDVSPAFSEVIMRALARAPEQRPASAVEFRDALNGGLTTRPNGAYAPLPEHAPKRPVALTLVSLALLTLLLTVAVLWWRPPPSEIAEPPVRQGTPPDREMRPDRARFAPPRPPAEAIEACHDTPIAGACEFDAPHGLIRGTCQDLGGEVGCVPDHMPVPGRGPRPR